MNDLQRSVRIGLLQMGMCAESEANVAKALAMTAAAAAQGAQIVVLPELFNSLYFCQRPGDVEAFKLAESIPGPTTERLAAAARQHGIVLVGGSIFERAADGRYFNTSAIFGPDGRQIGRYRKSHIPHDPSFYEQDYFAPGEGGITVHSTPCGAVSVLICYDQWFPEAARAAALKGAELIVYPTAIGTSAAVDPVTPGVPEDWELMWRAAQVGHAACNCVYVAAVNRVGREGGLHFWGGSFIADPSARLLAQGGDREEIVMAECRLDHVRRMQASWRFMAERRPALYGELVGKP